jgi:hypothetical protein
VAQVGFTGKIFGLVMRNRTKKRTLASSLTILVGLAVRSNCVALPVDLGAAGPGSWTVLETGSGAVSFSQSATQTRGGRRAASSNSQVGVTGNVGSAQNGSISATADQLGGDLYLGNNASAQFSGAYTNNRPVTGMVHLGSGATVSPNYSFGSVSDAPQPMLNQARLDAAAASGAAMSLSATSTLNQINLNKQTLTLNAGVYNLTGLQLNRSTLTLSGTGSFVFNISSAFSLRSAQVLLAGGATEANVLFNYTGTSDLSVSGSRKSSSVLHGIILALNARVNLTAGLVVGEIISGRDIIASNAMIQEALAQSITGISVPDRASTLTLSLMALAAMGIFRWFLGRRASFLGTDSSNR